MTMQHQVALDPYDRLRAAARERSEHTVARLEAGIRALEGRREVVTARTIERETGLTFKTILRNAAAYELYKAAVHAFRTGQKHRPNRRRHGRANTPRPPIRDDRSRDRSRLRRRAMHRRRSAWRATRVGRGCRRLALRAVERRARQGSVDSWRQRVSPGSRDPDAAAPAVGGHLLAQPERRSLRDGRASRLHRRRHRHRRRIRGGGDPLEGAPRLSRCRGGACSACAQPPIWRSCFCWR